MRLNSLLLLIGAAGCTSGRPPQTALAPASAMQAPRPVKPTKTQARTKAKAKAPAKALAKAVAATPGASVAATAPTVLYKTKGDYHNLVPVMLSADRLSIVAYPAPGDVSGPAAAPTALAGGYWLDNRGIGLNVAFLKLSYADYGRLRAAPSLADLDALILDRDPLTAYCDCGPRAGYSAPTAQLNALITAGNLPSRCKVLK